MLTKSSKVLGSIPQLSRFQRRRSRKQKGRHLSHEGGQKTQALACEPTSYKFDLASVLLSCPKYLRWRTPEGQQTLLLKKRPVQPMETTAQKRSAQRSEKSDGAKDKENKRTTSMNLNVESSLYFTELSQKV